MNTMETLGRNFAPLVEPLQRLVPHDYTGDVTFYVTSGRVSQIRENHSQKIYSATSQERSPNDNLKR